MHEPHVDAVPGPGADEAARRHRVAGVLAPEHAVRLVVDEARRRIRVHAARGRGDHVEHPAVEGDHAAIQRGRAAPALDRADEGGAARGRSARGCS